LGNCFFTKGELLAQDGRLRHHLGPDGCHANDG
jgi:hypothetical protein